VAILVATESQFLVAIYGATLGGIFFCGVFVQFLQQEKSPQI